MNKIFKLIFDEDYRFDFLSSRGLLNKMSDHDYLKKMFKIRTGRKLVFDNPQTYNQKLQWIKLYDHNPMYISMVDKYEAKKNHDINYILSLFGSLMVLAYAFECLKIPYLRVIKAAGHFRETQHGAYISAALNIVITITLVYKFGLVGAAIGTLIAMLFHTCYLVCYLKKNILYRPVAFFVRYLCIDLFIVLLSCYLCRLFIWQGSSYLEWVIYAIKVSVIVGVSTLAINCLCMRKKITQLASYVKNCKQM